MNDFLTAPFAASPILNTDFPDPAVVAQISVVCRKIDYSALGTDTDLTTAACSGATKFYETNGQKLGYHCAAACASLFYDKNFVCAKSFED